MNVENEGTSHKGAAIANKNHAELSHRSWSGSYPAPNKEVNGGHRQRRGPPADRQAAVWRMVRAVTAQGSQGRLNSALFLGFRGLLHVELKALQALLAPRSLVLGPPVPAPARPADPLLGNQGLEHQLASGYFVAIRPS